jgi:hypothetical protein
MNGCGDDVFLDLPVLNNMAGTGSLRSLLVEISAKIFDIRRRFLTARCQKSQKSVKKTIDLNHVVSAACRAHRLDLLFR